MRDLSKGGNVKLIFVRHDEGERHAVPKNLAERLSEELDSACEVLRNREPIGRDSDSVRRGVGQPNDLEVSAARRVIAFL